MTTIDKRTTIIMGAGAVLDMSFPDSIIRPTTWNITQRVIQPYSNFTTQKNDITVVNTIYDLLTQKFPINHHLWWKEDNTPNIHFEIIFHIMEQLLSYGGVWDGSNHNPNTFPYFALFTKNNFDFDKETLRQVMWDYIMRIMDIVNAYNEYFKLNKDKEKWYCDFFDSDFKWDVFNFNYDTTVETVLEKYEDGFEEIPNRVESVFNPQKLFSNTDKLSTINHLHGCINYYYKDYSNDDLFITDIHDLYLYPNFTEVMRRMQGRGQSNKASQTNEEYFAGPIITGLRKADKLSCIPYDFYHGNLYRALCNNNSLVIVGYSFGDIYVNNLLKRMHSIWQGKEKIVLIDKWDSTVILKSKNKLEHYLEELNGEEIEFLEMMSGCTSINQMISEFIDPDVNHPKYSGNGRLLLIPGGMKLASKIRDEIYVFLHPNNIG